MIDEDYDGPDMVAAEFFNGGSLSSCIRVNITDDDTYEGPQTFSADIVGSTVGMLAIGMPNSTTVEIIDCEGIINFICSIYALLFLISGWCSNI